MTDSDPTRVPFYPSRCGTLETLRKWSQTQRVTRTYNSRANILPGNNLVWHAFSLHWGGWKCPFDANALSILEFCVRGTYTLICVLQSGGHLDYVLNTWFWVGEWSQGPHMLYRRLVVVCKSAKIFYCFFFLEIETWTLFYFLA